MVFAHRAEVRRWRLASRPRSKEVNRPARDRYSTHGCVLRSWLRLQRDEDSIAFYTEIHMVH